MSKFKPQKDLHQKTHEKISQQKQVLKPTWVQPKTPRNKTPPRSPPLLRDEEEPDVPEHTVYSVSSLEEPTDFADIIKSTLSICHQSARLQLETAKQNIDCFKAIQSLSKMMIDIADQLDNLTQSVNMIADSQLRQLHEPVLVNRVTTQSTVSRQADTLNKTMPLPIRSSRSKSITTVSTKKLK